MRGQLEGFISGSPHGRGPLCSFWYIFPRATQAEAKALKAEKLAKDVMGKLQVALSRLEKTPYHSILSSSPVLSPESGTTTPSGVVPSLSSVTPIKSIAIKPKEEKPFWQVERSDIQFTSEELGKGRWGVVRVANYKEERVAARCLYNQIASEDNRRVFIECMNMSAGIRHPNILSFIGAVLDRDIVIVTELMSSNLKKVLDMGKLKNYQIVNIALNVADALLFLHTTRPNPVFHGDLTNTSVLLEKSGGNLWRAKIGDFMTAKFFLRIITGGGDSDREASMSPTFDSSVFLPRATTPRVTPPPLSYRSKQLSGSDLSLSSKRLSSRKLSQTAPDVLDTTILTAERDVYSFGLLLIEMCTGTTPLEVSLNFLIESITWTDMNALVKACTEYSSEKRPTMSTVVNTLRGIHHTTASRPSKFSLS